MARLSKLIPPGETVRWTSAAAIQPWRIALSIAFFSLSWIAALLYVGEFRQIGWALGIFGTLGIPAVVVTLMALFPEAEMAVTDGHVVWLYPMDIFGRVPGGGSGRVALGTVALVELEDGGEAVTLHGDGFSHRIKEVADGQLETLAAVVGRAARIWRGCKSKGAMQARRWQTYVGTGVIIVAVLGFPFVKRPFEGVGWIPGAALAVCFVLLIVLLAGLAERTLPHLLVGWRLKGEERRDFACWMTDPRWRGFLPDGSDDARLSRSRLEAWAMCIAYGQIPDIGEREPEILIPGKFPERASS